MPRMVPRKVCATSKPSKVEEHYQKAQFHCRFSLVSLHRGHWNRPTLREQQIPFHLRCARLYNAHTRKSSAELHNRKFVKEDQRRNLRRPEVIERQQKTWTASTPGNRRKFSEVHEESRRKSTESQIANLQIPEGCGRF